MEFLDWLLDQSPLIALFLTIAIGYIVGKFKIGTFVLGGIAGTLLVGVAIGQLGVKIDAGIKSIFFALFIYAVGFQGGPQFIRALSLRSLNEVLSAVVMCVVGLLCVLSAAWVFELDRGTAAGLAAGGLTQSAIIGTAGEAITKLGVSADLKQIMQANIAVGYAVCYIFGSLGPIIMVTWFFPTIMRWDIRAEAKKLAESMSGGEAELEAGQFNAARRVQTRFYAVSGDSRFVDMTTIQIDKELGDAAVEAVVRDGEGLGLTDKTVLQAGDLIGITGAVRVLEERENVLGRDVPPPLGFQLIEENRAVILSNPELAEKDVKTLNEELSTELLHGVFLTGVRRMGLHMRVLQDLKLHRGDVLELQGRPGDLDRAQGKLGYKLSAAAVTDFIFFGFGMTIGLLLGLIEFTVGGVPVTIGSGGGCLLSGLFFGWLRSTHPRFAALPPGASNFLRDFGLAVFVGVVGISAGPQVITTIQNYGLQIFFLGVFVTIIPQIVTFYFSYYVLRIQNPIEALSCVVGGRSANPGFAALLQKAGNSTPVVTFTVTYAVANVLLTLWGPLIVGIITKNPTP
ncbi:MAG: aspartate-alanine antiporter [Hyphomicrobiaceae bacterium]